MLTGRSASKTRMAVSLLLVGLVLSLMVVTWLPVQARNLPAEAAPGPAAEVEAAANAVQAPEQVGPFAAYLPSVYRYHPWISPFGVEPIVSLRRPEWRDLAVELRANWIRLNGRISWRELQPNEGDPIQWELLGGFEQELSALKAAGMTPVVIVDDYPEWATIVAYGSDGLRSRCAAILPEKYAAFAEFMRALVARYKGPDYDVHYWELGNEPDVDPSLVTSTSPFGCWGDILDAYYGGERYGEMLKVVTPAIKAEDPRARVMPGGLLLAEPETTNPNLGRPELFLEGILRAGGGDHFDVLAFHAYPSYTGAKQDYDLVGNAWDSWGGMLTGKAAYLRQVMALYGVQKPLFLNETALGCPSVVTACIEPDEQFFDVQASYVTRSLVRGIGRGIMGFVWFSLDPFGWRYTNLVELDFTKKPVYYAYQVLTGQLDRAVYLQPVDYGLGLEAYAFRRGSQLVHVVWARDAGDPLPVLVPLSRYVAAFDRDGTALSPTPVDPDVQFQVGFEPIYLILAY